jgi:hypothetical protein
MQAAFEREAASGIWVSTSTRPGPTSPVAALGTEDALEQIKESRRRLTFREIK